MSRIVKKDELERWTNVGLLEQTKNRMYDISLYIRNLHNFVLMIEWDIMQ